jgi:hypothetical protein
MTTQSATLNRIRMELAREPGHPAGDPAHGYEVVAPLDGEGRLDPALWRERRKNCTVLRLRPGERPEVGRLARKPGGAWYFDYDRDTDADDEPGFRFGEERFVPGEYVSVREHDGKMHTFRIVAVEPY